MPAWRHRWPQSFNDDVVKACNADADNLEPLLFVIGAAPYRIILKAKAIDVEITHARDDNQRRRGFGEGILIDVDDKLVLWMPRPEETFTLLSEERIERMRTTPGRIATAVNGIDLQYRAESKQTRRERTVANPAESFLL